MISIRTLGILAFGTLAACEPMAKPETPPDDGLLLLQGYRAEADQCRLTGESEATAEFLDDAADLVSCPREYEGIGVFVTETGAIEVGETENFILYSVPTG